MSGNRWKPEEIETLKALRRDDISVPEIAARLGFKPVQVRNKLCDLGLSIRRKCNPSRLRLTINMPKRLASLAATQNISPAMLARRLLHIIERDDLYGAVLDYQSGVMASPALTEPEISVGSVEATADSASAVVPPLNVTIVFAPRLNGIAPLR